MAEISAAAVKALRERTGLPMMDCKKALQEVGGDTDAAVEWLRKAGKKTMEKRAGRETAFGRIAVYADMVSPAGAMVELQCESAPVAGNEDFVRLASAMAEQAALSAGAQTADDLMAQNFPGRPGHTLRQELDDLANRIREVFRVGRIVRLAGTCGGYVHHSGAAAVLMQVEGGSAELVKDICMHVAAMRPSVVSREDLDASDVQKEREILSQQARQEGKPEKIIEKMVEGRLKDFYAQHCLLEQEHANKEKHGGKTIRALADAAGMKIRSFVRWELGKE